jgi:hypothetical protein
MQNAITTQQVQQLLNNVRGTTFANITTNTQVKTAAAHKLLDIRKITTASVQLFNNIVNFDIYANAVKRSANVTEFVTSDTYYEHTQCYSIVQHKTTGEHYLYAVYNNAKSVYMLNNVQLSKQEVAQYLTASAAAQLLSDSTSTYNATNNVTHNVIVRIIKLANITSITAMQQTITV